MANTTNLNLVKPGLDDDALITDINGNMDLIDAFAGTTNEAIANITPSIIGRNENNSHQWILMKSGNLYHLHYERLGAVANGTKVHTINSSYAPSSDVNAYDFYQQTSGYAAVRLTVKTTGDIYMNAVTHNENVAGVFDVYWTKS